MHVGEAALDAVVVDGEVFVIETEEVEDGGVEVVRGDGVVRGLEAKLIGGAVAHAAFHSGTGKPSGEAVRIVVAPVGAGLKHWRGRTGCEHHERSLPAGRVVSDRATSRRRAGRGCAARRIVP